MTRKTIDRDVVVERANAAIQALIEDGATKSNADKRQAIIIFTSTILLAGNAYKGFRYLERPIVEHATGKTTWDETRVAFN